MRVLHSIEELATVPGPVSVAIGVFDGVHLGHRALISRVRQEAACAGGTAVVLTFHPHPVRVLRPDSAPRLLTSTAHKVKLIEALDCPCLLLLEFTLEFASQAPEVFIEALAKYSSPLHSICVGHQWAFGRGRAGNVDLLRELGAKQGFETIEIDPVALDGEPVSSTRIRRCIQEGRLDVAGKLLGRPYTILGTVTHGARLGTKLGFPTANLAAHNEQFPPDGVYAITASLRGAKIRGIANVGVRPTVDGHSGRILEVHLLDFTGDCYGEDMEVEFGRFLRPEEKFPSVEALKARIARDVEAVRAEK